MGHRWFLPHNHAYRSRRKAFNSAQEFEIALQALIGKEVLEKIYKVQTKFGKVKRRRS